ncbi:hypothetical protein M2175_007043 [Bradyrhizobium elkanii]|nr:hypothetical protein [Bradyrhizobium elkanii]MCS3972569.1 hypothetical protein [Bradyrhizobium japonicum]
MINSVQSGLAVLATSCLTSFSISLNIRPWGDGSSMPGRIRSVLRPRSRALPIFLEGGAAAGTAGCSRHPRRDASHDRGTKLYSRLAAPGFVDHVPGPTKLTSWDSNSSPWHSGHLRSRARGFRGRMVGSTAKHHPQCLRRMAPRPRLARRDGGQAGAEREARQRDPKHANSLRLRHHIRQLEAGGELSPPPAHLCRQAANGTYR